ncbi:pyruvate dehydrogenase E1 component subunit alpha-1, mitochondrial-like [Typha latifolia]|uniref:pyruvate dehydrogenase E1 component subunit alpha-1, mitochondrial-like n=1 Tax=Typha latifolia TaxID=4733 RepID=UPI003C2BEF9D
MGRRRPWRSFVASPLLPPPPSASSVTPRGFSFTSGDETLTIKTSVPFTGSRIDHPSRFVDTTSSELLYFFRTMSTMHLIKIAADSLYKAKLIHDFYHIYDDQGAVEVGMEATITKFNTIITTYHDHCIYLDRGDDLVFVFVELIGRHNGYSRGKSKSI